MFQIELADKVENWDRDEQIGNIFTGFVCIIIIVLLITVLETTARQLAKGECKMNLASISIQGLAILGSSHV